MLFLTDMITKSVIVVDDDRYTRESLCEVLAELGWTVSDAPGGLSAWERLCRQPTDVVISDVDMPDISGFELLSRMHHHHIGSPVVLMSARADERLAILARDAGAAELVPKPVAIGPFTRLVTRLSDDRSPRSPEGFHHG